MHLFLRFILILALLTIAVESQGARGGSRGGGGGIRGGSRSGSRTSGGSSCTTEECKRKTGIIVGSTLGGVFGLLAVIFTTVYCFRRNRGRPYRSNADFVNEELKDSYTDEKDHFETGPWSSRYYQSGGWHGPHRLSLYFDRNKSTVSGGGTDDVGEFTVEGIFSIKSHRLALTKKYKLGTGNPLENFGHTVTLQLTWNQVNGQFEGKWFIQTTKYRGEDKFELKAGSPTTIFTTSNGV